jgi:peptide/nickel transport system substrate-binding protein
MKKFLINTWLVLLIFLIGLSCSGKSDQKFNGKYGGTLKVRLLDNPTDLDPRTSRDAMSYRVIELVYASMFRFDSTGKPVPEMVDSFSVKNNLEYTFRIRPGIYFHDGKPLTTEDIAFTFEWIRSHPTKAVTPLFNRYVKSIQIISPRELKITLREIYSPFLSLLTIGIVPKHIVEQDSNQLHFHPVGAGPFRFVKWDQDQQVVLSSFQNYFSGRPYLNRLILKIIPDGNTAVLALNSGDIDFLMNNFNFSNLPVFKKNPQLKIQYGTGSNYTYLAFNLRNRKLRKRKVRQAIAHAIDKKAIIKTLYKGIHKAANSLLPENHWAYNPNLGDYEYNPELAKKLLDQAGYRDPDGDGPRYRFKLIYKCTDKQESRQKAQIIQSYLRRVGIDVEIQANEWGTFFHDITHGNFDLYSATYVGIYEPDFYYNIFHTDNLRGGGNRFYYRSAKMDRLIILSQSTLDDEIRKHYIYQIQELAFNDLPVFSLWHETNVAVMNKRVMNFHMYPAAEFISFKNVYIAEK